MRYLTFSLDNDPSPRVGIARGDDIIDVQSLDGGSSPALPRSLAELVAQGPALWQRVAELATKGSAAHYKASQIRWLAPLPRVAKNIVCLGLNYASHAEESARARGKDMRLPENPVFFTKAPTAVTGPFDTIPWDKTVTQEVDWEAELAVIIGKGGRNIAQSRALDHVFGYTILNDVTARDLQQRHLQWFKGKSLDGFCPMGPTVVTADEFGDPQNKRISLRVNGVTKQNGTTKDMIFPIAAIIEALSRGMTLEPGDVISTGTPDGVGMGRTPPEYLREGDCVETEVEGIGMMRNTVVAV